MRPLVLCADDFGADPSIDHAVTALVSAGRLSAVSCMAGGPSFAASLPTLLALPAVQEGRCSVGLHL
ncbi:MAG: ChbG/HpnK family deacetylase, partial [Rubrivivax sp.]